MRVRYETRIRNYCAEHGVEIPPAFGRNSPSRYAIIRMDRVPPKLVATTWFKTTDVVYYIENISGLDISGGNPAIHILDFAEGISLTYQRNKRLRRGQDLELRD